MLENVSEKSLLQGSLYELGLKLLFPVFFSRHSHERVDKFLLLEILHGFTELLSLEHFLEEVDLRGLIVPYGLG